MSSLISRVSQFTNDDHLVERESNRLVFAVNGLNLDVYDIGNLVGFKLTGEVKGKKIYIVHDSDNYDRNSHKNKILFNEVETDAEHVARMFLEGRIVVNIAHKKGLFGVKEKLEVIIPNKRGDECIYDGLTVNTTNFRES